MSSFSCRKILGVKTASCKVHIRDDQLEKLMRRKASE